MDPLILDLSGVLSGVTLLSVLAATWRISRQVHGWERDFRDLFQMQKRMQEELQKLQDRTAEVETAVRMRRQL